MIVNVESGLDQSQPESPQICSTTGREPLLIDAQLHASRAHPVAALLAAMQASRVTGALLVQSIRDPADSFDYMIEATSHHSNRFRAVRLVRRTAGCLDPASERIAAELEEWNMRDISAGVRVLVLDERDADDVRSGLYTPVFLGAERLETPVFVFANKRFELIERIATAHPRLRLVLDHIGLPQPPLMQPDSDPFAALEGLVRLADTPNVIVKWSGAPTLSRQPFPYGDLWSPLNRVLASFGPDRIMWGTDITRVAGLHSYEQAVAYLRDSARLSPTDKQQVMGATLRRLCSW